MLLEINLINDLMKLIWMLSIHYIAIVLFDEYSVFFFRKQLFQFETETPVFSIGLDLRSVVNNLGSKIEEMIKHYSFDLKIRQ